MIRKLVLALALVLLIFNGSADAGWNIEYYLRDVPGQTTSPWCVGWAGSYGFMLATDGSISVYPFSVSANAWQRLGKYGQITLPPDLPTITIPFGSYGATAVPQLCP